MTLSLILSGALLWFPERSTSPAPSGMRRSSLALAALLPLTADAFLAAAPFGRPLATPHKLGTPAVVSPTSRRATPLTMGVAQFVAAPLAAANRGILGVRSTNASMAPEN